MIRVQKVIVTDIGHKGTGIEPSMYRGVVQVFSLSGKLIAEKDQFSYPMEELIEFGKLCQDNPGESALKIWGKWNKQ